MDEKAGGELRECPFCGLSAKVWFDDNADQKRFHYWTVGCRQQGEACKVEPQTYGNYKTKEEAIAAWNRRSLPVGMSEDLYAKLADWFEELAKGETMHFDHPLQHFDRTCPGCLWEDAICKAPVAANRRGGMSDGEAMEFAIQKAVSDYTYRTPPHLRDCDVLTGHIIRALHALAKRNRGGAGEVMVPRARYETFGYALAMAVLQSPTYARLDDKARAECDELIARGQAAPAAGEKEKP